MTRHRRLKDPDRHQRHKDHGEKQYKLTKDDTTSVLSTIGVAIILVIGVILCVQYWSYSSIAKLYQPLSEPKMVEKDLGASEARKMLWGTYRYQ